MLGFIRFNYCDFFKHALTFGHFNKFIVMKPQVTRVKKCKDLINCVIFCFNHFRT